MGSCFRLALIVPLLASVAACGSPGLPAKATVVTIDHECTIIETIRRPIDDPRGSGAKLDAQEVNTKKGECSSVEGWEEVRHQSKRRIEGTAAVHVSYQAPQDGSYQTATLKYDGRDDEFYELKAGDEIDILVAKDDPTRIRKG